MIPSEHFLKDSMRAIKSNGIAYAFYREQIAEIKKRCITAKIEITVNDGESFAKAVYRKFKEELE